MFNKCYFFKKYRLFDYRKMGLCLFAILVFHKIIFNKFLKDDSI